MIWIWTWFWINGFGLGFQDNLDFELGFSG
jgi:hypothetical protein